jgi:hypothetical protein
MTPPSSRPTAPKKRSSRLRDFLCQLIGATALPAIGASAGAEEPPRPPLPLVECRGLVVVEAKVVEPGGARTPVAELSGITWLGGDAYLAVMDSGDRACVLKVSPSPVGIAPEGESVAAVFDRADAVRSTGFTVQIERTIALDAVRDWEDVAVGAGDEGGRWLFAVEEDTPAIRAFRLDGQQPEFPGAPRPRGVRSLAGIFRAARGNRGPESLTLEPDSPHLWTANEEPLERDGPPVADGRIALVRLVRLPVVGDGNCDAVREADKELIYPIDPPHDQIGLGGGPRYCGVVALTALGGGRLLVLERSAAAGLPPFENRIFLVDTSAIAAGGKPGGDLRDSESSAVSKSLLWRGALGVNLEGLCLGSQLPDGQRLLVGVADNGGTGGPNTLALFTIDLHPAAITSP